MGCGASTDSFGENALYLAVEKGDADAVRGYIGKGVNVNWKHPSVRAPPPPRVYHGERGPSPPRLPPPPLATASPATHVSRFRPRAPSVTLSLSRARVSSFSLAQGDTPLTIAAFGGHVAIAEVLIAAGADVNLATDVRRAAARSCRARARSLSPSLSLVPSLSLARERRRRSRAARVSRRAILSTSDV